MSVKVHDILNNIIIDEIISRISQKMKIKVSLLQGIYRGNDKIISLTALSQSLILQQKAAIASISMRESPSCWKATNTRERRSYLIFHASLAYLPPVVCAYSFTRYFSRKCRTTVFNFAARLR